MNAKKEVQTINWTVLVIVVLAGMVSAGNTFGSLSTASSEELAEMQSRIDISFGIGGIIFALVLIGLTSTVVACWKRLFPYNAPLAIVLGGITFAFIFTITIVGWARLVGFVGSAIAIIIGVIMMLIYALGERRWKLRGKE
ncbi:hypothetical protein LCM10_05400 [Rossellomorea aquimaris]|uniref:hypothetical protein n=1 Tax=Rossellomorea aquimaris TaxID=189382 RepID=UPI001CD62D96|nr:hypothetical protein [Rossellomorea aquimaris]MCA1054413.1 hypothetical protein [Rossellomorea aquimaris]